MAGKTVRRKRPRVPYSNDDMRAMQASRPVVPARKGRGSVNVFQVVCGGGLLVVVLIFVALFVWMSKKVA